MRLSPGCKCCGPPIPCGCGSSNPHFLDPWHITDDSGSTTLTWSKNGWHGTTVVQCGALIKDSFGNWAGTNTPQAVTISYTLAPCYWNGAQTKWLLGMNFQGGDHITNDCPWAIADAYLPPPPLPPAMNVSNQSVEVFSCVASVLTFNFCQWLNCAGTQYSCFNGPGYAPVGPTPGGYGPRVVSR